MIELISWPSPGNNLDLVGSDDAARPAGIDKPRCEHCHQALPKRRRGHAGRQQRFCSAACRVAFSREKARFRGAGYNHPFCYEIEVRSSKKSSVWKAGNGHPYHSRFSVPLDILGRSQRWPAAPKLDRKIREAILWREGCAPMNDVTRGDNRLPILAIEMKAEHQAAHQAARSALEHADAAALEALR